MKVFVTVEMGGSDLDKVQDVTVSQFPPLPMWKVLPDALPKRIDGEDGVKTFAVELKD
tara:strand:- start:3542 stop:3715 length:174 start_codon:yes stop_codon:yes gene_type:complete